MSADAGRQAGNALVAGSERCVDSAAPASFGPLAGTGFVVKDVIDVAGCVTGAGNPDWAFGREPAGRSAACVDRLLRAGSRLIAKGACAEMAWSLSGDNVHFGMPVNPSAPERNPGGSTSGPASAVAAGTCEIGLGTDTLGSIRVPASYCGLWGLRPTHGAVPSDGVMPLAQAFDTVGVLTRDLRTLRAAASALEIANGEAPGRIGRVMVASDALARVDPATRRALEVVIGMLADAGLAVSTRLLFEDAGAYARAVRAFTAIQLRQVWENYGEWVTRRRPRFGPGVAERFARAATVTEADVTAAEKERERLVAVVRDAIDEEGALALPAAGGPAPARSAGAGELQEARVAAAQFSSIASLASLPEVAVPAPSGDGPPVGLGLVGAAGSDMALLDLAEPLGGISFWSRGTPGGK